MMLNRPKIKKLYNTLTDDVINEFYNNALSYFKYYDRVSAYFDSKILNLYSKGIENIIKNNGKIRFIFSHQITVEDYNLILKGYDLRNDYKLVNSLLEMISDLEDNNNISNLSYLIANNFVDVKIALTREGIFHDKFGLIYNDIDTILFRGSANETSAAIDKNYDSFETTCSWESNDSIIDIRKETFKKLWNNNQQGVFVIDAPDALIKKLLKFDKGKIIINNNQFNSIILDYDKKFFAYNNLENKQLLDEEHFKYRFIKRRTTYKDNDHYYFNDNNNYLLIENIIRHYKEITNILDLKLHISDRLKFFLQNKQYDIDKMKSLGISIKENRIKDNDLLFDKFKKFEKILSRDMERILRYPQLLGSFHIAKMIKSSNFSVPGSGKTTIVYGAYTYLNSKEINKIDKIVMIGPLNSFNTWKEEFKLNFGNKKKLNVLDLSEVDNKIYSLRYETHNKNLILINYEILPALNKNDIFKEFINEQTLLVFDEVHRIKNPEGIRASSALDFSKLAKYKVALTGTPIPNGYQDIYNILNILYSEEYNDYFGYNTADLREANNKYQISSKINNNIYPFFMRTTKKDLKIPVPNEDDVTSGYIEINDREKKLFEIIHRVYNQNSLTLYIRLLQASINPKSIFNNIRLNEDYIEMFNLDESRIDGVIKTDNFIITDDDRRFIENFGLTRKFYKGIDLIIKLVSENKKVLVWAVLIETIDLISEELNKYNIKNSIIYGSVSHEDRNKIINKFKYGDTMVLISNPHTIGESVSLHHSCHDAIYFEYTFNLTHMMQSRDRINRLGLTDEQYTQYYYMIMNSKGNAYNTIDNLTYRRLKDKEKLMLEAIEGKNLEFVSQETINDDLEYIFNKSNKEKNFKIDL